MAISYSWKLTSLKKLDTKYAKGFVIHVRWQKNGVDENGYTGVFHGESSYDINKIEMPFEQLTEETALNWVKNSINHAQEAYINSEIADQIQKKINRNLK